MIFVSIIIFGVICKLHILCPTKTQRLETCKDNPDSHIFILVCIPYGAAFFFGMLADSNFTCYTVWNLWHTQPIPFLGHIEYTATMLMQIALMFMPQSFVYNKPVCLSSDSECMFPCCFPDVHMNMKSTIL